MSQIKKNFIYNLILTVSGYVFAFITFPYVSRVLGVENIGAVNFVDSIVNYFILASMLGVSVIGIREVAKFKDDKKELENTFRDIFFTNAIITIISIVVLVICIYWIPKFNDYKTLLMIGVIKLLFNFTLIEWFYTGIENFKLVTIRSLIVKVFYVIAVLLFVRKTEDTYVYYGLTSGMVVINAIMNWTFLRRFITLKIKGLNFNRYIKPIFTLGGYMVLTSLYVNFTVVYLGFTSGNIEVGYYTTAGKLYSILLSVFTAFTAVMLPRMSNLLANDQFDEFKQTVSKSFDILFLFSFPIVVWTIIFAPQIIYIIAGKGYEGAIIPMRIIMPLMLIIGYAQILVIQILMPLKKDKIILFNSFIGAIIGLSLNFLIVGKLKSVGSSIVWLVCELILVILSQYFVTKKMNIKFPFKMFFKHILVSIPIGIICYLLNLFYSYQTILVVLIGGIIVFIYYLIISIKLFKNQMILNYLDTLLKKFRS